MGRAPCCDKTNVKRGPWSPEEDAQLKSYIENHGTGGNWIALPHKIGLKRCGKSCRLRWLNYLRPNIKHGGFTEDEDNLICTLYMNIGSRWSIIAAQLPGRTDNDIKNYWNTKLKKKLLAKQHSENKKIGENYSLVNGYSFSQYPFQQPLPFFAQNHQFPSIFTSLISDFQGINGAADMNIQEFDHGIMEDDNIMYNVSPEISTNYGDINNCLDYNCDLFNNYEILQKKVTQLDWEFHDEKGLLGFSSLEYS